MKATSTKTATGIKAITLADGQRAWQREGVHDYRLMQRLLAALARALPLGAFRPLPASAAPFLCEYKRLIALKAQGVCVPEVLAKTEQALIISDMAGKPLQQWLEEADPTSRLSLFHVGLTAIADVHRRGAYLSHAFARNLLFDGKRVAFIDFEEDPSCLFDPLTAQVRDWLCYLHSCAWLFADDAPTAAAASATWQAIWQQLPLAEQQSVAKHLRYLKCVLRLLPKNAGRDVRRLHAMGIFALVPQAQNV